MSRLHFQHQSRKPPTGPILTNWKSNKIRPGEVLKAISRSYKNTDYSFNKAYINKSHNELCNTGGSPPKLSAQQKFVADFMRPGNPTRGILIYHGLGSGKTITSIIVGEAMKSQHTGSGRIRDPPETRRGISRVLIVVPVALMSQYKATIQGWAPRQVLIPDSKGVYHPQNYFKPPTQLEKDVKKEIAKLQEKMAKMKFGSREFVLAEKDLMKKQRKFADYVAKRERVMNLTYQVVSHQRFLNLLMKKNKTNGTYQEGEIFDGENPMQQPGTLVIIDEVQRVVSEKGSSYQRLLYTLKYHAHPDLKVALLTATPIYDKPFEAALTMNLLRPRIPFPNTKEVFQEMFVKMEDVPGKLPVPVGIKNPALFKYLCTGYVSYYSGGNPRSFPFKTEVVVEHRMKPTQESMYKMVLESEIRKAVKEKQNPENVLEFLDAYLDEDDKQDPMNVFILTQMYSNIALPGVDDEMETFLQYKYNVAGVDPLQVPPPPMKKTEIVARGLDNLEREIKEKFKAEGLIPALTHLSRYSNKYATMVKTIIGGKGPAFIFSNFLDYGVNAIARILKAVGFEQYSPMTKSGGSRTAMKFAIWSSDTAGGKKGEFFARTVQDLFNSDANRDGSKLKVILGTRSIMEGVSFFNVRQVHISDPWWNESRIQQIAARAVRNCSHKSLPPDERQVTIFKHASAYQTGISNQADIIRLLRDLNAGGDLLRSFETETIEQYMYRKASQKMQLTQDFQNLLKEAAVDCNINKYGNLVRLTETYQPQEQENTYMLAYHNPTSDIFYGRDDIGSRLISYQDVVAGTYGYMNKVKGSNSGNKLVFKKLVQKKVRERSPGGRKGDAKLVTFLSDKPKDSLKTSKGLIIKERIKCNKTMKSFRSQGSDAGTRERLDTLYKNNILIPHISRMIKSGQFRRTLYSFINSKHIKGKVVDSAGEPIYKGSMAELRKKAKRVLMKKTYKTPHEKLVSDLIYKYELYGVEHEDQLLSMSDEFLRAEIDGHKAELARRAALEEVQWPTGGNYGGKKMRLNKKISCKSKSKK